MWEIASNSVGNDFSQVEVRPGQPSYVDSPLWDIDKTGQVGEAVIDLII